MAKVDELMALVDALETQLATAQAAALSAARTTAEKILTALVAELTAATPIFSTRIQLPLKNKSPCWEPSGNSG
jgi:hypothetical protein